MNTQKTLFFYITSLGRGGAERVLLQLAERFSREGWRAVFVTSFRVPDEYPVPPGVERLSLEDEPCTQNALRRNLSRIRALRALCRQYRPAALISFMAEPNFRAVLAAQGLPVKTVISVRNVPEKEYFNRVFRFVARHILPLADGCVFQTEAARAWFSPKLQKKSTVIMNQVSEAFFDEPPAGTHRGIVAVGRLSAQKNHTLLIRAYAALGEIDDPLTIYGEGPLRPELEALVRKLGLSGRVFLPGQSGNVPRDIKGAKLFVLPSDYEGMPNVLLEAMALGLACVSSDCPCGGPAAVIEDGVSGLLFPVGDEGALTACLRRLLKEESERGTLAENARRAALAFRPDAVFAEWKAYVENVIGG